jgi:4a-hydroxytetrahydrobiopterin dehydratase
MSNALSTLPQPAGAAARPSQVVDKLKAERVELFLKRTPEWRLVRGGAVLVRRLRFAWPARTLAFVVMVTGLAEKLGRQPQILLQGNDLSVSLTTPAAGGLTAKDLVLARRIQELAGL